MVDSKLKIIEDFSSNDYTIRLGAVKAVKNGVIGNPQKKTVFVQLGVLPKLVQIIATEKEEEILTHSIAAVGSFACGPDESVTAVSQCGVLQLITKPLLSNSLGPKLIESIVRTLKLAYQSKLTPPDILLQAGVLDSMLNLIKSAPDNIAELSASVLAGCLRYHRDDSSIQSEIIKRGGLEALVALLSSSYPKSQEASLDALGWLSYNNKEISLKIAGYSSPLEKIVNMLKDKRPHARLLAARCLSNLSQSSALPNNLKHVTGNILNVLVKLLKENEVQTEVPYTLGCLIKENEPMQMTVGATDTIATLSQWIKNEDTTDDILESALFALAEVCSKVEDNRKKVVDTKILDRVVQLLDSPNSAIRIQATRVIQSLSRSIKNLRTTIAEAGPALPLLKLANDCSLAVQISAVGALCNIVLDFSPIKSLVIKSGGIPILTSKTQSLDSTLKLHAVWALQNLVYVTDSETKHTTMKYLTYTALYELMADGEDCKIQEHALGLFRNLVHKHPDAIMEQVQQEIGVDKIMKLFSSILSSNNNTTDDVKKQALYCVCNIATGKESLKTQILNSALPQHLLAFLESPSPDIRIAAIWCLLNLAYQQQGDSNTQMRIEILKQLGCQEQLKKIVDDSMLENSVKDHAQKCLNTIQKFDSSNINQEEHDEEVPDIIDADETMVAVD